MYYEALLLTLMALHKEPSFKLLSIISWGWGCMHAAGTPYFLVHDLAEHS